MIKKAVVANDNKTLNNKNVRLPKRKNSLLIKQFRVNEKTDNKVSERS